MDVYEKALELHKQWKGKIGTDVKALVKSKEDLSYAYSPGVAEPCREIAADEDKAYEYTIKANTIAVVSDGSAVLGLGNIGAKAGLPVMEGKAVLFKEFGGVNAVPIVLETQDPDEIIQIVKNIAPTFGGINLEDISSPRCVYIEDKLKEELDIPVFHDDQHGTAIVTVAALINALKLVDKKAEDIKVVISGAGAAGFSCAKLIRDLGVQNIIVCDSRGAINDTMLNSGNPVKAQIAEMFNPENFEGSLKEAIIGADVFVGVSAADLLDGQDIEKMAENPIVFPMANPTPEIDYDLARKSGARVVGTGRSDYPNQINNVLAFPGIFKGALEARAPQITEEMEMAAAKAIADFVSEDQLAEDYIIPSAFEEGIADAVAKAVKECK